MKPIQFIVLALVLPTGVVPAQGTKSLAAPYNAPVGQEPIDEVQLEQLLKATRPPLVFHPDDIVTVQIFGVENYAIKQRVAENGTILFPQIGLTQVAGLTTEQLQNEIASSLAAKGMILHAQVSVVAESRPGEVVSVLGDVQHPGTYPAVGNLTVADYISQAQGFVESVPGAQASSAASYSVTLLRPTMASPVRVPLGPQAKFAMWSRIPVFAGDQIRVDKEGLVYAVGALKLQGSYQLKNTNITTVTQLIALAGGIGYEADSKDSHIVRRSEGKVTLISVNPVRIIKGQDPDIALQTEDILFVPTNQLKAAIKGGGPAIIVSLADALLYR